MNIKLASLKELIHNLTKPKMETNFIGAPSFRYKNPAYLDCYVEDKYSSVYPSIKAISNEFMTITPYAINANGEPLKKVPPSAINALYHPNQLDSAVMFREKLAVMNLTHRMTYLLVWRREGNEAKPGGDINPVNIAGFTFLENPAVSRMDGKTYYNIGAQRFSEDEVIAIPGGVDPNGLYIGYAPGIASARWATLDEYIADFQKGFFENGAVPAGQFVVTAASEEDFNNTVDKLQSAHRGANKNNNVTYTPRPTDPASGKAAEAKIEWIPFQQSNKDIDFKNLFEQANKRLDSAFGVPASVRGVGENNNYATARTDQQNFIRFAVRPLALRLYNQITHELNRITGGLGYAITFNLELPGIADEEKIQAETKKIESRAILDLTAAGFTLDSVVDALKLSNSYKLLKVDDSKEAVIENDKPDVDEDDEVTESPNPYEIDGVTPIQNKVETDEEKMQAATEKYMRTQIERVVAEYDEEVSNAVTPAANEDELDTFVEEMFVVILAILLAKGLLGYEEGIAILSEAGLSTELATGFTLPETSQISYRAYLRRVGESYGNDTADAIRSVLAQADEAGWTKTETTKQLRNIMDTDAWRVKRLVDTELNHSQVAGSVEGMISIQDQTGIAMEKSLQHDGSPECQWCQSMEGVWVKVDQPLLAEGDSVIGVDGGILVNNFVDNPGWDLHPNGKGYTVYRRAV